MLSDGDRKLLISKITKYIDLGGYREKLSELEDKIISFQDADLSLYWIRNISPDRAKDHVDIISNTQNPEKMWLLLFNGKMGKNHMYILAKNIMKANNETYIAKLLDKRIARKLKMNGSVIEWLSTYGSKEVIYQTLMEPIELEYIYQKKLILAIYSKLTKEEIFRLKAKIGETSSVLDDIEHELQKQQAYEEVITFVNTLVPIKVN